MKRRRPNSCNTEGQWAQVHPGRHVQVRIPVLAPDFGSLGEELMIVLLHDVPRFQRFGEAGPPGTGYRIYLGTE